MSFVCHSHVLVCHPYATRIYSYVIRVSLVCSFNMKHMDCIAYFIVMFRILCQLSLWDRKSTEVMYMIMKVAKLLFLLFYFQCLLIKKWHTGIPGFWTQKLDAGLWTLDSGCWTLDVGLWTLDSGRWTLDVGLWMLDSGRWTLDAGLWSLDSGRWTPDAGLWMLDSEPWTLNSRRWAPDIER